MPGQPGGLHLALQQSLLHLLSTGDPTLCGNAAAGTGYGCFQKQMIDSWRKVWSSTPLSSTSALLPFGVVSLAGGTSEGHSGAMPSFRNAQSALGGLLPNNLMPNTFLAQAYDAAEPAGSTEGVDNSCQLNGQTNEAGYQCEPGYSCYTPFFMEGSSAGKASGGTAAC